MFNYNPPIRIINKHVLTNYSYLFPKQTQNEQLNNPIASGIHPANPLHPCIRYNSVKRQDRELTETASEASLIGEICTAFL
jgi:hypothetical protein